MTDLITRLTEGEGGDRHCAICRKIIQGCNGFVKAGDLLEFNEGIRAHKDIRELCWRCSEIYVWSADGIGLELNPAYEALIKAKDASHE